MKMMMKVRKKAFAEGELTGQNLKSSQAEARYIIKCAFQALMASGAEVTDAFSDEKHDAGIP